jgi:hypothetical protein
MRAEPSHSWALATVALLALAAASPPSLAAESPDFSGQWRFNPRRSDDVKAAVQAATGPQYTMGDAKKEATRVELRAWLSAVAAQPDTELLTVEQTPTEFRFGFGDDVGIYYFGREGFRQAPNGEKDKTSLRWEGEQLIVEMRGDRGTRLTEVFTLLPGGQQLIVAYRMENKAFLQPLEARLMFDRAETGR